jgi:hypothetical protein
MTDTLTRTPRFTKQFAIDALTARIEQMVDDLGLDERNGYAQVTGRGEAWNRAYGEFVAYIDLLKDLESGVFMENPTRVCNDRTKVTRAAEMEGMGIQGGWQ